MTSTTSALKTWFAAFGWPVYGADDVPSDAVLPYITIPVKEPEYNQKTSLQVQLWAYTKSNAELTAKADAICAAIGTGVRIPCTGGVVVLWPDTPLQQMLTDRNVRRVLLMLQLAAYHCPGV